MSLDVTLEGPLLEAYCPHCGQEYTKREPCFSANITHNLGRMAIEAGIYECVWRPDEVGLATARQLITPLERGIALLQSDPDRFKRLDSPNGWGLYENFVPWLERYLDACRNNPDATVSVSR